MDTLTRIDLPAEDGWEWREVGSDEWLRHDGKSLRLQEHDHGWSQGSRYFVRVPTAKPRPLMRARILGSERSSDGKLHAVGVVTCDLPLPGGGTFTVTREFCWQGCIADEWVAGPPTSWWGHEHLGKVRARARQRREGVRKQPHRITRRSARSPVGLAMRYCCACGWASRDGDLYAGESAIRHIESARARGEA